eukprot:CAMPEP_0119120700 /NCGR_PEP_ID=MMETSP1310-20130426/1632_1 /TAXON_ID=464262 /ORGANISM="Genus nov. species nov., Strain RCC2339" /LENGTH=430 /DNA_ID=CAMNT_0007110195 /DNA_START=31 /DNA_END=1320 /DNA_ORIENTATION=+
MIDAFFIVTAKGDLLVRRLFRDDVNSNAPKTFRLNVVCAKEIRSPVLTIAGATYIFTRSEDVYLVAVVHGNSDVSMVFEILYRIQREFTDFVGKPVRESSVRSNLCFLYELLLELIDFGYPQPFGQELITTASVSRGKRKKSTAVMQPSVTSDVTGATPWRNPNTKYKKNEVYIDVIESVNMLVSAKGTLLRADVEGQIKMRALLSGMPECKFGMNDKIILDSEAQRGYKRSRRGPGIQMDDCSFHQCVRLGKFGQDRTISFIPPDGEFELMNYRITENIHLPFKIYPQIDQVSSTRIDIRVRIRAEFNRSLVAYDVLAKIPTPLNTADPSMSVTHGRAKYRPQNNAILWKIKKFPGGSECEFTAQVVLALSKKEWVRPPISIQFRVPMFTASGVRVRFLKIVESRLRYTPLKWVRYVSVGQSYEHRLSN